MHTKVEVKQFLDEQKFAPSKKMGQNFLYDINYQNKIITAANIKATDLVIEIGPGLGALTKHLVKQAQEVIAIELDKRLYDYLQSHITSDNFHLINNDVLKVDFEALLNSVSHKQIKVVANLPYSISSKIVCQLIACGKINEIYILVQKEMAMRICATVGSKDYNAFTCLLQMFADVKSLFKIPPQYFVPAPEVDSVFVGITYHNKFNVDFQAMNKFLKLCFHQKRKTIFNNLSAYYPKPLIETHLAKLGIAKNIRSEQLTIQELHQLYELFEA